MNKVFKVPKILRSDASDEVRVKKVFQFFNYGLKSTILTCREVNLTTQEIWDIIKSLKREMVERKDIGCNLGNINSDDFQKLLKGLKTKIPKSRPKVTCTEIAYDHALAFDLLS